MLPSDIRGKKTNSPKKAQGLHNNQFLFQLFLKFSFLLILCHDNKQERLVMSDAAEILKSVQIGLNVVIFLLNTDRGPQATELCNECAILLQNLDCGSHLDISDVISNVYYAISGNTSVERYTKKLLYTLHHAGRLTIQLGDKYEAQRRFVEAKQLFNSALIIMQTIGHKSEEVMAHGRLGTVCISLSEMHKAKE